ncbi:thiol-disulfide isomerase/thioredoxin [Mucilaginibacter rubeus]|uniref:TlpA family protein disulfide reductase n=1 Tax=Mucilaginibacter rubeus TaxID=2027860 RepID=UPI0033958B56
MKTTVKCIAACFMATLLSVNTKAKTCCQTAAMQIDSMLNQPAPDFVLKDLDGKTVSLSNFRGKTLVIDFWATWCHYCKASFSSAQSMIEKYKGDPDVKFLFIDTREKYPNYLELINKILNDNHYTFKVVLDEKGDDGIQNKIYKAFGCQGVPTKIIVDKKGIVRYKILGFDESLTADTEIKNVSALIDQVKRL